MVSRSLTLILRQVLGLLVTTNILELHYTRFKVTKSFWGWVVLFLLFLPSNKNRFENNGWSDSYYGASGMWSDWQSCLSSGKDGVEHFTRKILSSTWERFLHLNQIQVEQYRFQIRLLKNIYSLQVEAKVNIKGSCMITFWLHFRSWIWWY